MNAYLGSRHFTLKFLLMALVITLLLAACERPLQTVTEDGEPTPTPLPVGPTAEPDEEIPSTDEAPPGDGELPDDQDSSEDVTPPVVATMPTNDPTSESPSGEDGATATPSAEDESPRGDEETGGEAEGNGEATETPTEEATAAPEGEATPEPTAEPTAAPTGEAGGSDQEQIHTVQSGENLYRIGLQYGISWTVLAEYNGISNPNSLVAGQQIRIPPTTSSDGGVTATPAPQVTHVVQPGETLFIISQQYGVVWTDIAAANNLVAPYTIHAGQTLVIPGG